MSDKQGYTSTVSSDQIISSVKGDLGLMDNNFFDVILEKWIFEGVRHICTNQLFVKNSQMLTVTNNRATLPPDFRRLLGLRYNSQVELTNADGSVSTVTRCIPLIYIDRQFAEDCGCDTNVWGTDYSDLVASYEIIGNEIICRQNIVDGSELQLSYIGFALDDNCMLLIHSDYERGLSAYTRMKFLQCYPEKKGNFTPMLLQAAMGEWRAQKRWLKAQAVTQEFINNRYQINALATAWFVRQSVSAGAQF